MMMMKTMRKNIPFLAITWLLFLVSSSCEEQREAPVCYKTNENCSEENTPCQMHFSPSPWNPHQWTLYSAVTITAGSLIGSPDLLLSITDANPNEYSPWHDLVWDPLSYTTTSEENVLYPDALWETNYLHEILLGGIGSLTECGGPEYANIELITIPADHHSRRGDGSASTRQLIQARAIRDIRPGEVLLTPCQANNQNMIRYYKRHASRTFEDFMQQGMCMDTVSVQSSSNGGYGAFSKQHVSAGQVLLHSPVLLLDRSQLNVVQQQARSSHPHRANENRLPQFARGHGIQFNNTHVLRRQLFTNYVYGRDDSNVLLWPMAPGSNFIQHAPNSSSPSETLPNVRLQWSREYGDADTVLSSKSYPVMELLEMAFGEDGYYLVMEYVALRDIQPGDEILLDYGSDWDAAWSGHQQQMQELPREALITADEYTQQNAWGPLSTTALPSHLQIACHFMNPDAPEEPSDVTIWQTPALSYCWRPCDILERLDGEKSHYTVIVHSMESIRQPSECGVLKKAVQVTQIPREAIRLMNRPYTLPEYSDHAFRHELSVPLHDDFYPRHWLLPEPQPYGDFIASPLTPGMMAPIRWQSSAQVVTPWAFRVGVPASVRQVLLEYCESMGIMDIFRHVTIEGNALQARQNGYLPLADGTKWYLQRPGPEWRSNLHWLSPGDEHSHEHYLQALSAAGFDTVLDGVGKYLGMDGLVAFHVTFIAVSQSTEGYQHHDVLWTGAKTYNVIVPLLLANHTGPELDLVEGASYEDGFDDKEDRIVGRYRYEYEVGSMMGDGAVHATSAVDYRRHNEMRLAATIYIADVNEQNANSILKEYTQAYPPDDRDLLLSWAGRHWKKTDPSSQLPRPSDDHILMRRRAREGTVSSQ
jgi:hypothetical protein